MQQFTTDLEAVARPAGYGAHAFMAADGVTHGFVQLIWNSSRSFTLHRLWTLKPGGGNGGIVLAKLCELADRHGIEITLKALPFGRKPYPMSGDQLADWYRRYGFVGTRKKLVRRPAGSAEPASVRTSILKRSWQWLCGRDPAKSNQAFVGSASADGTSRYR